MYLKQLTVRGFKSFASATTFTFEPGVTAVVGPNGSGKSNVVDALAWVMGEQGAKNLRGGKMDDVIFAGTTSRPALGRAQVTLTIDNSDGALPIEYSEVTISRTLFRNGGSEYSINDRACRLLDIQELLSDSGLGREMHVIVGQGQLDRVLHATSEDRRGLIEEAAGVLKHRRRREKAYRKLQSTDANLARLADLTSEVARALKPLERQANVARRARDIQFDLKDAQSRLAADALESARSQERATASRLAALSDSIRQSQTRADAAEARMPESQTTLVAAQQEVETAQRHVAAARRSLERLGVVSELAATRIASMAEPSGLGQDQEIRRLESQLDEAAAEAQDAERAAEEARALEDTAAQAAHSADAARKDAEAVVAQRQREQAQAREELLRVKGTAEAVGGRVQSARNELERAQALAEDAAQAETQAHRDLADLMGQGDSADGSLANGGLRADEQHGPHNPGLEMAAASGRRSRAEKRLVEARARSRSADARVASLSAKAMTLTSALSSMSAQSGERHPQDAVSFADGLTTDPAFAQPIGALLASAAVAPVLEPGASSGAAVWAEPLGEIPIVRAALPEGVRPASAAVSHSRFGATLGAMLAEAFIVDSADLALRLLRDVPEARYAVTMDGVVISRTGQSRPLDASVNAVDLRAQLDSTSQEMADADAAAAEAARDVDEAEAEAAAARGAEQELRAAQAKRATERAVREAAVASARRSAEQARQRAEKLHAAAEQSAARLGELLASHEEARRRVELLEGLRTGDHGEEPLDDLRVDAERLRGMWEKAQQAATEAALARRSADERRRALLSRLKDLEGGLARARSAAEEQARAERRRRTLVARAERIRRIADGAGRLAQAERDQASRELEDAQRRLAVVRGEHESLQRALRVAREDLQRFEADAATATAHLEHESSRRKDLERDALEQLGQSPDELIRAYGPQVPLPDGSPFVREEQVKRLKRAQAEMQALGKVNPLALEEFAALEQRHTFLASQLADLRGSRGDLLKIIRDVDETIEKVFAEAYRDTAREFVEVFARLFPGGEGSLELTNPDDLLSSGLEVNARPAGKKVKRLSLLSGGERSLTAIALLVAIFKARPSPFYVMDEVEAALDDANLGRLIGLFRELRDSSQLIIVTHQKRTMEIADALYGVSMRGDGVSLVISQRLERESAGPQSP